MTFILTLLANAVGFFVGAYLLPGVQVKSFITTIFLAVIVSILNATVGYLLKLVTLGLLGWGVFSLILSAIIIRIADYFLDDFKTDSFIWALLLAVVVAVSNMLLLGLLPS